MALKADTWDGRSEAIVYDQFYDWVKENDQQGKALPIPLNALHAKALVDYLSNKIEQNTDKNLDTRANILSWLSNPSLPLEERWRLLIGLNTPIPFIEKRELQSLLKDVKTSLLSATASRQLVALTLVHEDKSWQLLGDADLERQVRELHPEVALNFENTQNTVLNRDQIRDLFYFTPDWDQVRQGQYAQGIKLFLFCRKNRNHPCLFVAKDQFDLPVIDNITGELWHQGALAASSSALPSRMRNGQTPTGVHTIDSVMPLANRQNDFGKFRRLILNWLPSAENEEQTLALLPTTVTDNGWWREALISRDVGRVDLRIHGTGKINEDPTSTYYPFRKTSGCISQREGQYPEALYQDQNLLLRRLMASMGLELTFANEEEIKGVLYVVEIGTEEKAVSFNDIKTLLQD